MNQCEMLDAAEARIREHRTAEANLRFCDGQGRPVPGFSGQVRLVRHEFKLGANAFGAAGGIEEATLQREYEERFAALLNYATLPFYWGGYEPEPGRSQQERLERMADWCRQRLIAPKGHPLVWHEVFPKWASQFDDADVIERLKDRVREIVSRFAGRIDTWDVVNEATVSQQFDNAVGRWVKRDGAAKCVLKALEWAHHASPRAALLYNDFNVFGQDFAPGRDFPALIETLLDRRAPLHAIGIQSHMHKAHWPLEKVWEVCETYRRFERPLHFTEVTLLSGRCKATDDNDWHAVRTDWDTTRDGEERQLEYGQGLYTILFSHPAVEAITWWDLSDLRAWQGAPAGLIRKDMSPKPLYEWLVEAFHRRWATNARVLADPQGEVALRCFFGEHEVRGRSESGQEVRGRFTVSKAGDRQMTVTVA